MKNLVIINSGTVLTLSRPNFMFECNDLDT